MDQFNLQERYEYLASRWKNKTISSEEEAELMQWLNAYDETGTQIPKDLWKSERELKSEIYLSINTAIGCKETKTLRLWPRIIGVAAAVAAIVFGVFFFKAPNGGRHPELVSGSSFANDIAPGKNTATLTLANGKTIILSDVKTGVIIDANSLKYNDGSEVASVSRNDDRFKEPLTITTPRGGTYQVRLPDGTKVWLNAASSLTYYVPLNERGGIRKVELSGEAYFEVFKNKNQPFVVNSKNLMLTVLGTHFNVNAYEDEGSTRATLLEGSVKVTSSGLTTPSSRGKRSDEGFSSAELAKGSVLGTEVILKPNQQAILTNSSINCVQVNPELATAWKDGLFRFDKEGIETIMKKLSRWYNIDIVYEGPLTEEGFTGKISRNNNISEVLMMLEQTKGVHFKVQGRKVTVTK